MTELFGIRLYISTVAVLAYWLVWVPNALCWSWIVDRYGWRRLLQGRARITATLLLAAVLLSLPWWDVVLIGLRAQRLCAERAGLHVFKTVEAEGFLNGRIGPYAKHDFSFTEDTGIGGKKYRYFMQDDQVQAVEIPDFASRYELQTGARFQIIEEKFRPESALVVDRQNGEVISELVIVHIYPGWLDSILRWVLDAESPPWTCGDEPPSGASPKLSPYDLVVETIKPKG